MSLFKRHSKAAETALRQAVDEYYEPIYRHVRRLVGDHQDAGDVVQNTFLKACGGIDRLNDHGAIRPWLYRIATNEAMSLLRDRNRFADNESVDLIAGDIIDDSAEESAVDPRLNHLDRALMTLTVSQRTVFDLRHFDEMSFKDIAEITGGSPDTVRVVYHHAKEKMRKYLTRAVAD